ncbi:MAG: hypothetical protein ACLFWI_17020 [Coleofasciculus sp.]|uniref:hypothetical protein n=1 Tax=Coleofasciculus sp. TaxID=3100458 RepID=UPI003A1FE4EC
MIGWGTVTLITQIYGNDWGGLGILVALITQIQYETRHGWLDGYIHETSWLCQLVSYLLSQTPELNLGELRLLQPSPRRRTTLREGFAYVCVAAISIASSCCCDRVRPYN